MKRFSRSSSPEQAAVFADPTSPAFMVGIMTLAASTTKDEDKIREAFRNGNGLGWHEHHHDLVHGTERQFKPGYAANIEAHWLPALDGVAAKLVAGGSVADLGCGHGASTILLAPAYPDATVAGFDYHRASIDVARKRASEAGVADRASSRSPPRRTSQVAATTGESDGSRDQLVDGVVRQMDASI